MGFDLKTRQEVPLSETQKLILEIFKTVKVLLDRQSVEYHLLGGSLLGAVRHQGFIPWDDDIDIGIEREKYEFVLESIQKELPEHLELRTYKDNTYHYYFSRIVDKRYFMERDGSLILRRENVWIDIFPLDGMPNNLIARKIHMFRLMWVRARYHIACFDKINLKRPNRPLSERIVINLIKVIPIKKSSGYKDLLDALDILLKKYKVKDSNWIVNFMGQYKFKEMFPKSYYGKGKLYPFENMALLGPERADLVLKQMYGDYMKEPKDKDKNVHLAFLIET